MISDKGKDCAAKSEERTVRGNSLEGLINEGSTVRILFGFYDCNEIRRGDVVAYNYSGNADPIIKIVKGLPGDSFELKESGTGWNIRINDEIVRNSKSEPYLLNDQQKEMLSLYANDYKGIIPENAYLIMGNLASGSLDSSHFGLIDERDILGKAVPA